MEDNDVWTTVVDCAQECLDESSGGDDGDDEDDEEEENLAEEAITECLSVQCAE